MCWTEKWWKIKYGSVIKVIVPEYPLPNYSEHRTPTGNKLKNFSHFLFSSSAGCLSFIYGWFACKRKYDFEIRSCCSVFGREFSEFEKGNKTDYKRKKTTSMHTKVKLNGFFAFQFNSSLFRSISFVFGIVLLLMCPLFISGDAGEAKKDEIILCPVWCKHVSKLSRPNFSPSRFRLIVNL